jgi:F0F1-type ATP synthase assembly protein I
VPPRKSGASQYAEYSALALLLPASTVVGYFIGHWLDERLGTHWLTIAFLVLGSAGGFVQLIRRIVRDSNDDGDR